MSRTEAIDTAPAVKQKRSKKNDAAAAADLSAPPQDSVPSEPTKRHKKAKQIASDAARDDDDTDADAVARKAARAAKKKARKEALVVTLKDAVSDNATATIYASSAVAVLEVTTPAKKDKKCSKKTADGVEPPIQPDACLPSAKSRVAENNSDGEAAISTKRKAKKRDSSAPDAAAIAAIEAHSRSTSEQKKKKREAKDSQPAAEADHRKKRKKDKYPNPAEDPELSGHAQKAIANAHAYVVDSTAWKFNKAAQNWLLRNIWSDTAVPDRYSKTVIKFLRTVQGGARQSLATKCQLYAAEPPAATADAENPQDSVPTSPVQRARAEALLTALGSSVES